MATNEDQPDELSRIIAYGNGDILDIDKCKEALGSYWNLNEAETRSFDRLCKRADLKELYIKLFPINDES